MNKGIRFDLEYDSMPLHKVDAVVFDIGNILIRFAPDDFLEQLFPGDEKMQKDIETYGLFTLEDFGGMISEAAFEAFNGAYLKVAMAKGLLTWEDIAYMAERYIPLM